MNAPGWLKALFLLLALGVLQLAIQTLSSQNGWIAKQIQRYAS